MSVSSTQVPAQMAKILLVDDDVLLCKNLLSFLRRENHTVETLQTGKEAIERLDYEHYDVIILDWELPDLSGVEICRRYRTKGGHAPVLMLTGKDHPSDKVQGLDAGADDYLTKPFNGLELCARIRALARRQPVTVSNTLSLGNLELNTTDGIVKIDGKECSFFPKEVALLEFFLKNQQHAFASEVLLERLWSTEADVTDSTIRTYIAKLRSRLEKYGANVAICTRRKFGYQIEGPSSTREAD
ncbi:MAG: response regulator transcription factor [Cyanobacteria bacterium]|nr:response regulator transcription factor [Cyanobacteriota bacterium]